MSIWTLKVNLDFRWAILFILIAGPLLSVLHVYSVAEEMRAAPVNTLNSQRTAMIVADFVKTGNVSSPVDLRYREDLIFPDRLIDEAGSVNVGQPLRKVVKSPSKLVELREIFPNENFLINCKNKHTDMILAHNASGEDALRGWLVAAFAADMEKSGYGSRQAVLRSAYEKMQSHFPSFISEVKKRGWHTDQFLDGLSSRFSF